MARGLDRLLFAALVFLFISPLFLSLVLAAFPQAGWTHADWLRNRTLWSLAPDTKMPWSWKNFFSARYQSAAAADFDRAFPGRECLVRLYNEFYFRAFGQSTVRDRFVFGRDSQIFELAYLKEFFLHRPDAEKLEAMVRDIAALQEACRRSGIAFAFVVTPSKASIYPEYAPEAWQSRLDPRPQGHDELVGLLKKHGVYFVDGAGLAREEKARGDARAPVFPKGGAHWGSTTALAASNALLKLLRGQGLPVNGLNAQVSFSEDPYSKENESDNEGIEADGWSVMNLAFPWRYPVVRCAVLPDSKNKPPKLTAVFVGGSFLYRPIHQLMDSAQFAEIDYYYYYSESLKRYVLAGKEPLVEKVESPDFGRDIFAADALVLEVNEQRISDPVHLRQFLKDALNNLPDPQKTKKAFSFKAWPRIEWGRPLSFFSEAGAYAIPHSATSGFSSLQEAYTWTDGKTAKVVCTLPDELGDDAVLRANVGAFLCDRLPQQEVNVYVNEEKVAEWTFSEAHNSGVRIIPLPRTLLSEKGARLATLRFEIGRPMSPFDAGLSEDKRKLGIYLRDIWLSR